jgi:hypothetical protein
MINLVSRPTNSHQSYTDEEHAAAREREERAWRKSQSTMVRDVLPRLLRRIDEQRVADEVCLDSHRDPTASYAERRLLAWHRARLCGSAGVTPQVAHEARRLSAGTRQPRSRSRRTSAAHPPTAGPSDSDPEPASDARLAEVAP